MLLIFDEVVTGFRLALGGAQEYFGVTPDLATYGKIVGGGGPLGAVGGREDILDCANPKRKGQRDYTLINGTLHGNPIAAVAGRATISVLREPGFYDHYHEKCDRFRAALQEVFDKHSLPARIAGQTSFWQILFADKEPSNQMEILASDQEKTKAIDLGLLANGVFVLPNVRRFFSAAHDNQDLEDTVAALDEVCGTF